MKKIKLSKMNNLDLLKIYSINPKKKEHIFARRRIELLYGLYEQFPKFKENIAKGIVKECNLEYKKYGKLNWFYENEIRLNEDFLIDIWKPLLDNIWEKDL